LMFSMKHYDTVAEAYIRGLERRLKAGKPLGHIWSVASVFVSRVETLVDRKLEDKLKSGPNEAIAALIGQSAVANSKVIYQRYKEIFKGDRFKALREKGGRSQWPLWASTGTKNHNYSDVKYVEELIGPDTVNTMPPATLDAFRDHGRPRASLTENVEAANQTMEKLAKVGISMKEVTDKLTEDGVRLFAEAFNKLLQAVEKNSKSEITSKVSKQTYKLPDDLVDAVKTGIDDWRATGKVR